MIMNYEDKLMQYGFRFSYNSATLYILLNTTDKDTSKRRFPETTNYF